MIEKTKTLRIVVALDVQHTPSVDENTLLADINSGLAGIGMARDGIVCTSAYSEGAFIIRNGALLGVMDQNNQIKILLNNSRFIRR